MNRTRLLSRLLALVVFLLPVSGNGAPFTSLHVFGDGVCSTTDNSTVTDYYGSRYCNGRVWVEVMSEWLGLSYSAANNLSYFGHGSVELKTNAASFTAPADVETALFVVWCNDADFVDFTGELAIPYVDPEPWENFAAESIEDHVTAISTLYDKGVRMILAPNAVDVLQTPYYNGTDSVDKAFARARIEEYNEQFEAAMRDLMEEKPGLRIVVADTFGFFDDVIASPEDFGLVNPVPYNAGAFESNDGTLDGDGASYVFWDDYHPTAKFQMHLAAYFLRLVAPVRVGLISVAGGTVQLRVENVPLGRSGHVEGSADMEAPWVEELAIDEPFVAGGSTTKDFSFAASGGMRFYRVGFPVVWTWP